MTLRERKQGYERWEKVGWLLKKMAISHRTKKPSSRRQGSCDAMTRTPRRGHVAQNRTTPVRRVRIRPPAPSRKLHPQAAHPRNLHQTRRASLQCPMQPREQHTAHNDHSGCTLYCYFCYCCYCSCLTLLSVSLLLLLSPPPNTSPSASVSTLSSNVTLPLPFSSPSQPLTSCSGLSCTYSDVNGTSAVPPCFTSDQSLILFYLSSSDFATSDRPTSSCHDSSTTPTSSRSPSDSFSPPHHPVLCQPWPSSRSLLSLLLCPPSFGDPVLPYASTLEHIPSGLARPRTLLRQQSLQQPLIRPSGPGLGHPPTTSQSLGQLHTETGQPGGGGGAGKGEGSNSGGEGGGAGTRGSPRVARGSPAGAGASRYRGAGAGGRSRVNPGSWDYMMDQIRKRGLDVKSFLWVSTTLLSYSLL